MRTKTDIHVECVSDFCGNHKSPGAWADIWERSDGSRYVSLGGGWEFYAPNTPAILNDTDPLYFPFLESCKTGEDFGFAKEHWTKGPNQ